jgi:4-hydroxy-3-methylbut-2-enyl diphosphate reductase
MDEWAELREHAEATFPDIWMPNRSDLCFATTNRQAALRAMVPLADVVVVIGSANSSNTVALTAIAETAGCPRVLRVNGAEELPNDLSGVVAVTAGASAPESLVREVIASLSPVEGVEEMGFVVEEEYFPPPPELRELLRAVSLVLDVALGASQAAPFDAQADREFTAAQVLASTSI